MIRLHHGGLVLALAGALAASSVALPALAESNATEPAAAVSEPKDAMNAEIPTPQPRPAAVAPRKRVASAPRPHRPAFHPAPYWPPYERVALHWPVLFIGIGW